MIPGYDTSLHTPEEDILFYRNTVFPAGPIWGAFEGDVLRGHIALEPGWIEHFYVDPPHHGRGIGQRLLSLAKAEQSDLQLWTFQTNVRARRIYELADFNAEEFGDGCGNEAGMPNVRYRWRA